MAPPSGGGTRSAERIECITNIRMNDNLVVPGTCLGHCSENIDDENAHVKDTLLYSSVLGIKEESHIASNEVGGFHGL